jgi:hypothetical protein
MDTHFNNLVIPPAPASRRRTKKPSPQVVFKTLLTTAKQRLTVVHAEPVRFHPQIRQAPCSRAHPLAEFKPMKCTAIVLCFFALLISPVRAADPLPSWQDTAPKQAIVAFVEKVTKPSSPDFVPVAERIATFDNDGTLWSEQPLPVQCFFISDRIKALAPQHPEWTNQEPFASVLKNDLKSAFGGGDQAILAMLIATQSGITTDEFEKLVTGWIATARHPQTHQLCTEMVYQPMLEVLAYLRANGFKTYIVSGGSADFMRPWSEKIYGVPPEQVIGSSLKTRFELRDGVPAIVVVPELNLITAGDGKPIGIQSGIGRRPIASFGNSDNDLPMMQWTAAGTGAHLCLYVHHTDAKREWAYDRQSGDPFDKGLDEALAKGWTLASMKDDWKIIYPGDKKP